MKFVSYNIQYGFGADGRYDLARAAKVIADADVVALQEVERNWQRTGNDDQPELLSRLLPHHYWVYGPAFDMDASTRRSGRQGRQPPPPVRHHAAVALSDPVVAAASLADAQGGAAAQHAERSAGRPDPTRRPARSASSRSICRISASKSGWSRSPSSRRCIAAFPWKAGHGAASTTSRSATGRMAKPSPRRRWRRSGWAISTASRAARNISPSPAATLRIRRAAYLDGFVDAAVVAGSEASASHTHVRQHRGEIAEAPARLLLRRLHACRSSAFGQRRYGLHRLGPFSGHDRHRPGDAGDGCRPMTLPVFLAVLAAAAMHAAWNATIKVRLDRFASISLMTVGMGVVALPALPLVALPGAIGWLLIAASVALHIGYRLFLVKAYAAGDLAQTYPLARGAAPLLTTLGGIVLIREIPDGLAILGILLLSAGHAADVDARRQRADGRAARHRLCLHHLAVRCRLYADRRHGRPLGGRRGELCGMAVRRRCDRDRRRDGLHTRQRDRLDDAAGMADRADHRRAGGRRLLDRRMGDDPGADRLGRGVARDVDPVCDGDLGVLARRSRHALARRRGAADRLRHHCV